MDNRYFSLTSLRSLLTEEWTQRERYFFLQAMFQFLCWSLYFRVSKVKELLQGEISFWLVHDRYGFSIISPFDQNDAFLHVLAVPFYFGHFFPRSYKAHLSLCKNKFYHLVLIIFSKNDNCALYTPFCFGWSPNKLYKAGKEREPGFEVGVRLLALLNSHRLQHFCSLHVTLKSSVAVYLFQRTFKQF